MAALTSRADATIATCRGRMAYDERSGECGNKGTHPGHTFATTVLSGQALGTLRFVEYLAPVAIAMVGEIGTTAAVRELRRLGATTILLYDREAYLHVANLIEALARVDDRL